MYCLPGKPCTSSATEPDYVYHLLWDLDKQLSLSPWFKKSRGRDHVLVMSHWLWPLKLQTQKPHNLKKCNQIVFEEKNFYRLNNVSHMEPHSGIGKFGHPAPRVCQTRRRPFKLAKHKRVYLSTLYVNPHAPCPIDAENYSGPLGDFMMVANLRHFGRFFSLSVAITITKINYSICIF